MVVGDDFQSIYRFSGCNLDIFINFNKYFNDCKIIYIYNTYRNSQELINVAGNFIMKNRIQNKKTLFSNKHIYRPIKIVYYSNQKEIFKKLILYLVKENEHKILILGRNNNDVNKILSDDFKIIKDQIYYKDISFRYLTVHKSKGLEEENVIIINLVNDIMGFPSKLEDDSILHYIVKYSEIIPFEEERRLFYVALTRTKKYNYLLVDKCNPSIFVKEILRDYSDNIEILSIN
jgi:DNA helicase-4